MRHTAKNEISHEELDKETSDRSGRFTKIGSEQQISIEISKGQFQDVTFALKDKIIYPINICPHCGSETTFHQIIQENNDVVGNVWRDEQAVGSNGFVYKKFDYCLDCHREFLIEVYIWKRKENNSN